MDQRPNILIFMTDQQRGATVIRGDRNKALTPNLDRFSSDSVTFTNTFCPSPHCCPSRATFMSGLYPSQHGVWNNVNVGNALSRGLFENVRLWSEDLRDAGYCMDYSGKWHVSDYEGPAERGWREHHVTACPRNKLENRPYTSEWSRYTDEKCYSKPGEPREPSTLPRTGYFTYRHYLNSENPFNDQKVVDAALEVVRNRKSANAPWCQFVGTLGPHDPYMPPEKFMDMYRLDDIQLPPSFSDEMADKPGFYRRTRDIFGNLSEEEHRKAVLHYLAFCSYEDHLFGRILDELEAAGGLDNTIVIYTSDHGDYMADHKLWCKGVPCFKGAYHVPLMIRWPNGIVEPGRTCDSFVSLADFAPTFLEAAGVAVDREFAGTSLMPLLRNEEPDDWRDTMYTQTNGNELYAIQRGIFDREWKYVYNGFDYDELYDLKNDPEETVNLAGCSEHKDRVNRMCAKMWDFVRDHDDTCINPYIMVRFAPVGPGVAQSKAERAKVQ